MKSKNPISVGEFEILYICVSTNQNTINLYPLRMELPLYANFHLLVLSSFKATNELWTARLVNALNDAVTSNTLDISETDSTTINLDKIVSFIEGSYTFNNKSIVVVNYGGGLKQFTVPLFRLKDKIKGVKIHYVYPDKSTECLIQTEYTIDTIRKADQDYISSRENFEDRLQLLLNCGLRSVLSLFSDKDFSYQCIVDKLNSSTIDTNLVSLLNTLPDLYANPEATDFLYNITVRNFENNEENEENSLNVFKKLKEDKVYKNEVKTNIINDFNVENLGSGYKIDDNFSLLYNEEEVHHLRSLPGKFRSSFWKYGNYITESKLLPISLNLKSFFKTSGLNCQNIIDHTIPLDQFTMRELMGSYNSNLLKIMEGHGDYFEYYTLKRLYIWSINNLDIVTELLFNFSVNSVKKDNFQVEAVLYTTSGNIYFFECKTYQFKNKDFLAAYLNMSELGGVFNQYTVILPPLPSEQNTSQRKKAIQVFSTLENNIRGRSQAYICQIPGTTGKLPQIGSLDDRLEKIGLNERKSKKEISGSESIQ